MTKVPELLTEHTEMDDVGNYLTDSKRIKSLSSGDLPTIKQFVFEDSSDDLEPSGEASLSRDDYSRTLNLGKHDDTTQTSENKMNRPKSPGVVRTKESESLDTVDDLLTLNRMKIEENSGIATATYIRTEKGYDVTSNSGSSKIISTNLVVKENVQVNIRKMRDELQQLALATESWKKSTNEYLSERTRLFEQLKVTGKYERLAKEEKGDEDSEIEDVESQVKKISALGAENESLRKELKAKDGTFSETEAWYRGELEKHKQLANEVELAKQEFEAEQQIRFNSAINKVMKEKEVSLKKASEELAESRLLQKKNEEKLQILFNEKEELRREKEDGVKKLTNALEELTNRKVELENCVDEMGKSLENKEKQFVEQLENEKKDAAAMLEAEKQKSEESSGSG